MKDIKSRIKKWYISYDPYTDLFQIYDDIVFKMPKDDIKEEGDSKIRVFLSKKSGVPVLLEIKNAYEELGLDIDNVVKSKVVELVEPYIAKYA